MKSRKAIKKRYHFSPESHQQWKNSVFKNL
nr:MAG TPA: Nuclear factor of activated T-cells Barrel, Domain Swap, Forkhead.8A [Caudoviricetes sp.]